MIEAERFILDCLQGRLNDSDGNPVRLIQSPPQYNNMPTLTIDNSAGATILSRNKNNILIDDEPKEVIETKFDIDIRLDIWALSEDDRQCLINQVQDCFFKALADHYTYCTSYMNDSCDCVVGDSEYEFDKRACKGQCPCPNILPYENLFTKYNIDVQTFNISLPYNLDELEESEAILRSRFNISFDMTDYYVIGGITSKSVSNITEEE
jgi:hypothetical protein